MVTNFVISLIDIILSLVPDFEIPVFEFGGSVLTLFATVGYFLPIDTIATIFSISLAITGLRIVLSIIYRIKSFIPSMGA